jgi:hypothetical protein
MAEVHRETISGVSSPASSILLLVMAVEAVGVELISILTAIHMAILR